MREADMQVLIIEDHELVRRGLRVIVEEEFPGTAFAEAATSQEGLQKIHEQAWDLVLLDLNLPGRSGLEVLEDIKRLREETPVLVISAYPEEEFAIRALKLRASGYLTKSCVADELKVAARKALGGRRYMTAALAERLAEWMGSDSKGPPHENLSNRELQVLRLVAVGRSIKEISAELSLSEKTVGTYRHRLGEKMGLGSNVEIARYALQHGLVE